MALLRWSRYHLVKVFGIVFLVVPLHIKNRNERIERVFLSEIIVGFV
ncbi:hypothetical protein bpmyx0001_3300 [Bacillus pseudomycoides DSM 12442]|nr:hypothetical protein bpmyx0001_3300 [Bacillus pseudomycoides DSM 12442]